MQTLQSLMYNWMFALLNFAFQFDLHWLVYRFSTTRTLRWNCTINDLRINVQRFLSWALRTRTMKNWEWRCKFKHKILVKKDFIPIKRLWSQKSIRSTSQEFDSATQRSLLMPVKMNFSSIRVKHFISSKLLIKGTKRTSTVAYCKLKKRQTWCFWKLPKEKV